MSILLLVPMDQTLERTVTKHIKHDGRGNVPNLLYADYDDNIMTHAFLRPTGREIDDVDDELDEAESQSEDDGEDDSDFAESEDSAKETKEAKAKSAAKAKAAAKAEAAAKTKAAKTAKAEAAEAKKNSFKPIKNTRSTRRATRQADAIVKDDEGQEIANYDDDPLYAVQMQLDVMMKQHKAKKASKAIETAGIVETEATHTTDITERMNNAPSYEIAGPIVTPCTPEGKHNNDQMDEDDELYAVSPETLERMARRQTRPAEVVKPIEQFKGTESVQPVTPARTVRKVTPAKTSKEVNAIENSMPVTQVRSTRSGRVIRHISVTSSEEGEFVDEDMFDIDDDDFEADDMMVDDDDDFEDDDYDEDLKVAVAQRSKVKAKAIKVSTASKTSKPSKASKSIKPSVNSSKVTKSVKPARTARATRATARAIKTQDVTESADTTKPVNSTKPARPVEATRASTRTTRAVKFTEPNEDTASEETIEGADLEEAMDISENDEVPKKSKTKHNKKTKTETAAKVRTYTNPDGTIFTGIQKERKVFCQARRRAGEELIRAGTTGRALTEHANADPKKKPLKSVCLKDKRPNQGKGKGKKKD